MRHFTALVLSFALAACDPELTLIGGGGADAGGAPGNGGEGSLAGAQPVGGEGGSADIPVCPVEGQCLEENNCLLWADGTSRCREIECDLPSPCDPIEFTGSGPWALDAPFSLETPDALACVLAGLRDGTTGSYTWFSTNSEAFSGDGHSFTVHVQPGRVGLGIHESAGDLGTLADIVGPVPLREPGYFDGCAALSSGDGIWSCLGGWTSGCP